jgi:hypothetical protein
MLFNILYSTIKGVSLDRFKVTCEERLAALENKFKYLAAKLKQTGSSTNRITESSFPVSFSFNTALPVPISPVIENFICYLLVYILIVSDRPPNSRQILLNSLDGIVQTEVKVVSGIPKFYESKFINERLNSDILSPLFDSNLNFKVDGSSSHCKVMLSSFPAIFNILATFYIPNPRVRGL